MPVDPYSLIVAARRYHAVRGAVIAMQFIKDRTQQNALQVSAAATPINMANLPVEVIDVISTKLLEGDTHNTRCDCWARYWKAWEGPSDCACHGGMEDSCRPGDDDCELYDDSTTNHCMYRCRMTENDFDLGDQYDAAMDWRDALDILQKKDVTFKDSIGHWTAVRRAPMTPESLILTSLYVHQLVHLMLDDYSLKVVKAQVTITDLALEALFIGDRAGKEVSRHIALNPTQDTWRVHGLATIDRATLLQVTKDGPGLDHRFMAFVTSHNIDPASFESTDCIDTKPKRPADKATQVQQNFKRYRPGLQLLCESSCEF